MLRNYFKIALRNILRNKTFSLINILGLTSGTVCCLYILLYVNDQYGYDTYHQDAESIYRVRTIIEPKANEKEMNSAASSPPIAMTMKQDFPEVVAATRVQYFPDRGEYLLKLPEGNTSFYESKGYLADSTFFQIFNYKFLEGKALHSLDEPYTVVLSSKVAHKLFGKNSALNEQVVIGDGRNSNLFKVTGVFDETFGKSHLRPHFIMTMNSGGLGEFIRTNNQWAGQNFIYTYVKLNSNAKGSVLQSKLPAFIEKYGNENLRELGMKKHLILQNATDIHLHSKGITRQIDKVSDVQFLKLLLAIAFCIQLIACINFINLTTARSVKRAKEIGIRKVVGAIRSSLILQFLTESVVIACISILLAIPFVLILLPWLNTITGSSLAVESLFRVNIISLILGLGLLTGLLSGLYPALYLSGFRPVRVLKGIFAFSSSTLSLRKVLVVFQFVIALVLIVSVIVITEQINFMQSRDLGFNKEQKIIVPLKDNQAILKHNFLRNEIWKIKDVNSVGGCATYPSKSRLSDFAVYTNGHDMNTGEMIWANNVDQNFFNAVDIPIIAGRNFSTADTITQTIVNAKVLEVLNIDKEDAIGTHLYSDFEGERSDFEIVGVTADYNFDSLKEDIKPMLSFYSQRPRFLIIDSKSDNYTNLLAEVGTIWNNTLPGVPFEYSFLDDDIQQLYEEEQSLKTISFSFTLLAIIISSLGLFGLAMFTAQQRIKEIGIRKVLGASVNSIASMLSKDFIKPVCVSIIFASPLAWWIMSNWLSNFAYRITIGWWIFAMAGTLAILIALFTVSFQSIKAAIANPVKNLRTE